MRTGGRGMQRRLAAFFGDAVRTTGGWLWVAFFVVLGAAGVQAADGAPQPWQLGLQESATQIAREINSFHDFLLWIIVIVSLFVLGLLVYVIWKFNEKANPVPSKVTHHTMLEVAWTVVPILILLVIAVPSFRLLFKQYDFPVADVVIKATGAQWYWTYEYQNDGPFTFDSLMVRDDNGLPAVGPNGEPRTLAVDNYVVVPVNKNVELLITASDVIHAWTIPAFGVKVDAVPGRVIRAWFRADTEGTFYGQCSELCGKDHAFMPIGVRVVSDEVYKQWLEGAKKQFASAPAPQSDRKQIALAPAR